MVAANNFWSLTGHDRFMALNAFFEHLGLIAGLVFMSVTAARALGMASIAIALETAISSRPPEYARSMRA